MMKQCFQWHVHPEQQPSQRLTCSRIPECLMFLLFDLQVNFWIGYAQGFVLLMNKSESEMLMSMSYGLLWRTDYV